MNKAGKSGVALLFGSILGAIAAFLFGTNKEGDTTKEVNSAVKKTKASIRKVDKKKVLNQIDKTAKQLGKHAEEAVKLIEKKLSDLKKTVSSIDKTKYQKAVEEVIAELKKTGKTTGKQVGEIKNFLMADYAKVAKKVVKKGK